MGRTLPAILFALTVLSPLPAMADLIGITFCIDRYRDIPSRLFVVEEHDGSATDLATIDFCRTNSLAQSSRGTLYTIGVPTSEGPAIGPWADPVLIRIERGTWISEEVAPIDFGPEVRRRLRDIRALALSPDDILYAIDQQPGHTSGPDVVASLYRVNMRTGVGTLIGPTGFAGVQSMTFAPDGTLYGWDAYSGLVTIDPSTGAATDVNPDVGGHLDIATIVFTRDGRLFGARYDLHAIDPETGEHEVVARIGRDLRGLVFREEPEFRLPDRIPEELPFNRLFLVDCAACPACYGVGRPCDPRVNPLFEWFAVADLKNGISEVFSRSGLDLTAADGPVRAAAPVGAGESIVFAASLPHSGARLKNAGAVLVFDRVGNTLVRLEGRVPNEMFGMDMDVRGDEIAVVSTRRLVRVRDGKIVQDIGLGGDLNPSRGLRVAFTGDTDGDDRPEILLGAPFADAGKLGEAGRIDVVGSKSGTVIESLRGRVARQRLGSALRSVAAGRQVPLK